jgi:hypothetical protein
MYYYKPFFHKYKNYYQEVIFEEEQPPTDTIKIDNFKNALLNGTIDDIKNAVANLPTGTGGDGTGRNPNLINAIIYGGSGNCDCSIYIQLIQDSVNKIVELDGKIPRPNFNVTQAFNTSMKTVLSWRHVKYIQKHGVPDDGVFIEELLNEFND